MNWRALARHVGLMAAACTVAAALAGGLAFLVSMIDANQVGLDPFFLLTYAVWGFTYFTWMFALPLLPVLWAAGRLGLAAQLGCVVMAPIYTAFVSNPVELFLASPVNAFLNSSGIVSSVSAAVALYFCGDAYLTHGWRGTTDGG